MKRFLISIFILTLVFTLAACSSSDPSVTASIGSGSADSAESGTVIRIAGLKGPTSMGLVRLMDDAEAEKNGDSYVFTLYGSADEVTPKLIQSELDMAAIPANLASVLYNNTNGAVQVLAVNTLGVLDIVEKGDSVTDFESLKGKTVYATGKGSTPEYTLRYLLEKNGIDPDRDLILEFKSEPAEVVSLLASRDTGIAMLPQPYVTAAQAQVSDLRIAIDLNDAWTQLGTDSQLVTGVLVARTDFINAHKDSIDSFLNRYRSGIEWVQSNPDDASVLIEKYGISKAAVAVKALPFCNITFLSGDEMKSALEGYLQVLADQNPKAVGGKLPDEAFYYSGK